MKQATRHDKHEPGPPGADNTRHEQEDAASRDHRHQREGGYSKEEDETPKQTPP